MEKKPKVMVCCQCGAVDESYSAYCGRCGRVSHSLVEVDDNIYEKLNIARGCMKFKGFTCENMDCLNVLCPINKKFRSEVVEGTYRPYEKYSWVCPRCKDDALILQRNSVGLYFFCKNCKLDSSKLKIYASKEQQGYAKAYSLLAEKVYWPKTSQPPHPPEKEEDWKELTSHDIIELLELIGIRKDILWTEFLTDVDWIYTIECLSEIESKLAHSLVQTINKEKRRK